MDATMCDTAVPKSATIDDRFDAGNHAPFAPMTTDLSDVSLVVDGWECEGYINQTDGDCDNYELVDGEWVHVGTETVDMDEHYVTWTADAPLPSYPDSDRRMLILEYAENAIHFEDGEPVEMAPGYGLTAFAGVEGDSIPVGEVSLGTFRNLAAALEAALAFLTWVEEDGAVPDSFDPDAGASLSDVLEDIGLPGLPGR